MAMKSKYLVALLFCASCADNSHPAAPSSPTPPGVTPLISSLSPATATAGSDDITVTITGSAFQTNPWPPGPSSFAMWSESNGVETFLSTRFVSETQLTVIVPAKLLKDPKLTQVFVVNGDWMSWWDGYRGYPQSTAVSFAVVASR